MNIGKLKINNPLFLAPMAGITDQPFRQLCKKMGAGVVYTEFVSANGIIRENMKTLDLMKFSDDERPIGIQIFGEIPEIVAKSAKYINDEFKPDLIDINFGCPVPKVTKKGAGSAALKDLCLMDDMVLAVVESVKNIPITVKMRAGWDLDNIVSTNAGERLEKLGVSAITLHPRTTKQQFGGKSNWNLIKELKDSVTIPIIGNGDVNNLDDYQNIISKTNCDGVMIGRGALGNPWIFSSILNNNKNINKSFLSIKEIIEISKIHFNMLKNFYNEKVCVNHTKKHFSWYFKGFNNAGAWRKKIMQAVTIKEIDVIINAMEIEFL